MSLRYNNLKKKKAMNAKFSGVIYVEEIIYVLLKCLYDCTLTVT